MADNRCLTNHYIAIYFKNISSDNGEILHAAAEKKNKNPAAKTQQRIVRFLYADTTFNLWSNATNLNKIKFKMADEIDMSPYFIKI